MPLALVLVPSLMLVSMGNKQEARDRAHTTPAVEPVHTEYVCEVTEVISVLQGSLGKLRGLRGSLRSRRRLS